MILEEIFEIVLSMSKKEKAFFVRYTKMYSSNANKRQYLLVYDKIYQQTQEGDFDEKKLFKSLQKKISLNNLNNYKKYLHQQLLQSLAIYHKNSTSSRSISNQIQIAQVLYEKGLINIVRRLIVKTKAKAQQLEDFMNLIQIINLQCNVAVSRKESYSLLKTERNLAIQQYDQVNDLQLLHKFCFELNAKESFLSKQNPKFEELYNHPLIQNEDLILSVKAEIYVYSIKAILLYMVYELKEARNYQFKILDLIIKNNIFESGRLATYQRILYLSFSIGDLETYKVYEKEMLNDPNYSAYMDHKKIRNRTLINYYRVSNNYTKGNDLLNKISVSYRNNNSQKINPLDSLFIADSILFLCHFKQYEKALTWINWGHSASFSIPYPRVKLIIKALELIIHIELKNNLLLPSLFSSFKRELKKQIVLGWFEKLLLNFFQKSFSIVNDKKIYQELIEQTHQESQKLDKENSNPIWIHFFDFKKYFKDKAVAIKK